MSQPEFDNWQDGAYGIMDYSISGVVANASNVIIGTNPAYAVSDFLNSYPQFGTITTVDNVATYTGVIPQAMLQMFITLASASINQARYCEAWEFAIGLYVAHYATLFLQTSALTGATAKQVVTAGLAKGIQVSKSVGDASVSYKDLIQGWEQYGQFNLTLFGQMLIQQASIVGMGGMYVF